VPVHVSPTGNLVETVIRKEEAEPSPSEEAIKALSKPKGKVKTAGQKAKQAVKIVKKKKPEIRTPEIIERDIAAAETKLEEISQQMGLPEVARNPERLLKLDDEYRQTETRLKALYEEWESAAAERAEA
jgi:ABC transporter C-terminal domain